MKCNLVLVVKYTCGDVCPLQRKVHASINTTVTRIIPDVEQEWFATLEFPTASVSWHWFPQAEGLQD